MTSRFSPLKIRWVRHKTAKHLVNAYCKEPAQALNIKPNEFMFDEYSFEEFISLIESQKMWGFADYKKNPPQVHFWSDGASLEELTYLLAHEVGHLSGKSIKKLANEEARADSYGTAVVTVLKQLKKLKMVK